MNTYMLTGTDNQKKSALLKLQASPGRNLKHDFGMMVDSFDTKEDKSKEIKVKDAKVIKDDESYPKAVKLPSITIRTNAVKSGEVSKPPADIISSAYAKAVEVKKIDVKTVTVKKEAGAALKQEKNAGTNDKIDKTESPVSQAQSSSILPMLTAGEPLKKIGFVHTDNQQPVKAVTANVKEKDTETKSAIPAEIKEIKIKEFKIEIIHHGSDNLSQNNQRSFETIPDNNTVLKTAPNTERVEIRNSTISGLKMEMEASASAAALKAVKNNDEYMVVIKINPPSLGEVEIKAKYMEGRELNVTITANSDTALIAIKAASENLKSDLSAMFSGQGTGVNVDVNQHSRGNTGREVIEQPPFIDEKISTVSKILSGAAQTSATGNKIYLA